MVQRAKDDFRKRIDEEFFHTTDTLWQNEVDANIATAKIMLTCAGFVLLSLILNYLGVFTVDKKTMLSISIQAILEFVIPAIICFKFEGKKKWLKVFMLLIFVVAIARLESVLTHNVTLLMVLPIATSVRYYSSILTDTVSILTTLLSGVAEYCSVMLKMGIINLNVIKLPENTVITYINNSIRDTLMSIPNLDYEAIWNSTFVNAYLPKLISVSIIAIVCSIIASRGRKAIFDQKEETQKTERISTELNLASDIQANMLPNIFPAFPNRSDFDIFATMSPAKEVGGDFYDFFMIDDDHLALVIADVSGKGIPAAMFMVIAKTLIKDHAQLGLTPSEVFTRVNNILCDSNEAGLFVTAWLGILDLRNGVITYANAGHNPPVVCLNNEVSYLKQKPGFVLAGMEGIKYTEASIQLHRGDKIFLYTDGATEATNINNELYGEERLLECLRKQIGKNVEDSLNSVRFDIDKFVGEGEQFDDLTLLSFDYYDKGEAMDIVEKTFEAKVDNLHEVLGFIEEQLEMRGASMKLINIMNISVEEMYANICMYAYPNQKTPGECTVGIWFDGNDVNVMLIDNGIPFNPLAKEDPNVHATAEERGIGGLGIYMVKEYMDECTYDRIENQNIFTMKKAYK